MKTYLVTGASGFIGANFIKYLLYKKYKNEDIKVIVLDLLTYAGNLGTIKNDIIITDAYLLKVISEIKHLLNKYLQNMK